MDEFTAGTKVEYRVTDGIVPWFRATVVEDRGDAVVVLPAGRGKHAVVVAKRAVRRK